MFLRARNSYTGFPFSTACVERMKQAIVPLVVALLQSWRKSSRKRTERVSRLKRGIALLLSGVLWVCAHRHRSCVGRYIKHKENEKSASAQSGGKRAKRGVQ
jgi:hypothetical protein